MACVHYGVTEATKDCDVLCCPAAADSFLEMILEAEFSGAGANYRGNISPPLHERWMGGGWTSHFVWQSDADEAYLDVFGVPPRGSSPWEEQMRGIYASPQIVGEMKRTNRMKDWPFVTALGLKMLEEGDPRGWLHIFDAEVLLNAARERTCPPEIVRLRPVLQLMLQKDRRLPQAVFAEKNFWAELDRCRIHIYERALRPYVAAVRKASARKTLNLRAQHELRCQSAERYLPDRPIAKHGIQSLISEARQQTSAFLHPDLCNGCQTSRKTLDS
jgi:hypothetical protein